MHTYCICWLFFFFFNDTATTEIYTLSPTRRSSDLSWLSAGSWPRALTGMTSPRRNGFPDRKSTRLNSSHLGISYAVFCLKQKTELQSLRHLVCRLLLERQPPDLYDM